MWREPVPVQFFSLNVCTVKKKKIQQMCWCILWNVKFLSYWKVTWTSHGDVPPPCAKNRPAKKKHTTERLRNTSESTGSVAQQTGIRKLHLLAFHSLCCLYGMWSQIFAHNYSVCPVKRHVTVRKEDEVDEVHGLQNCAVLFFFLLCSGWSSSWGLFYLTWRICSGVIWAVVVWEVHSIFRPS